MSPSSAPARDGLPTAGLAWRAFRGVAGVLLLCGFTQLPAVPTESTTPPPPSSLTGPGEQRDFNRPIIFGTQDNYYPYSYRDENGQLKGFAIDLVAAIAQAMQLKINLAGVPNADVTTVLQRGTIDAISLYAETPERWQRFDFSVPVLQFEMVVLVRNNDTGLQHLSDLKGHRVAVGQRGSIGDIILKEQLPTAIPVYAGERAVYLKMLEDRNGCDAAMMPRLTALILLEKLGIKNLRILDDRLQGDGVRYCLVTRKGDPILLARLNEGLSIIRRNGQFDAIYNRWFGHYEKKLLTPLEIVSYIAAALALICAGAMCGFLRQRSLRQNIARQAAELAEQRSLLTALHERHPLATFVLEIAAARPVTVVSLNSEAMRLFGLPPGTAPGGRLADLVLTPEFRRLFDDAIARWHQGGRATQWEMAVPSHQQLLEVGIVPLSLRSDGAQALCVLVADITKRRRTDDELAKSRRLLALGELVGGIAHEFNNLLTPIIMTTSMLQGDPTLGGPLRLEIGMIEGAAKRAADLTRRLLTFGRKTDAPDCPVSIVEVVTNCETLLKTMVDRRIEWKNELPDDLPLIVFNPTDLNQIVFNLVLNARDTLMDKLAQVTGGKWQPQIVISVVELPPAAYVPRSSTPARTPIAWQRLTVADNGLGIPPEFSDRIFDPFFTTKEVGKGTGLGLSTIWHQVTDAGGDVRMTSTPGEGTAFHVYLPRWESPVPAVPPEPAPPLPAPVATGARILLVDDEEMVVQPAALILRRSGHAVTVQSDSVEAWELIKDSGAHYDLLVLDLNMPSLNGIDLIRHARRTSFAGRIIVMSGRISEEEATVLQSLQVDRVLAKPFSAEQLVRAVAGELSVRGPDRSA